MFTASIKKLHQAEILLYFWINQLLTTDIMARLLDQHAKLLHLSRR